MFYIILLKNNRTCQKYELCANFLSFNTDVTGQSRLEWYLPCGRKLLLWVPWRARNCSWSCTATCCAPSPMHGSGRGNPRYAPLLHATLCQNIHRDNVTRWEDKAEGWTARHTAGENHDALLCFTPHSAKSCRDNVTRWEDNIHLWNDSSCLY